MRKVLCLALLLVPFLGGTAFARRVDINKDMKECSDAFLTLEFRDRGGTLVAPFDATFWVYDEATNYSLWPVDTAVKKVTAPGSTYTLNIGPAGQRVIDPRKDREIHIVTVVFHYDTSGTTPTPGVGCQPPPTPNGPGCITNTDDIAYPVFNLVNLSCNPPNTTPTFGPTPATPNPTATPTGTP